MGGFVSDIVGTITGANAAEDAANAAAAQQREAAQNASYAAQFRPVGMTTRFGTSQFTREIDPKTGMPYVSSAGYTASPELAALQNRLFSQFVPSLSGAEQQASRYAPLGAASQGLLNLGQQYLATSPEKAAQDYMASQQGLLQPGREQQLASLRNKVFQTGRSGLATGGTSAGGRQATNPEMAAYYNAVAQQDAQIAANAQQAGQQRATFGASLLGTGAGLLGTQTQGEVGAYAPLQNLLGLSGTIEQYAQQPYQLGMQLGASALPGQTAGANMYNQGFQNAANTAYQGAAQKAAAQGQFMSSLIGAAAGGFGGGSGGMLSGFFNPNSTASPFFNTGANVFSPSYMGGTSWGE